MKCRDVLNTNVPAEVQSALINLIVAEYRRTHMEARKHAEPEALDFEPYLRRANIESGLVELSQRFPDKVSIGSGTTPGNHHFRYLTCGKLLLTQSYVEHNRRVPRDAMFRNGFAGDPNQFLMFPEEQSERNAALKAQRLIYAIITHSPSLRTSSEPSHITALFVDKNCKPIAEIGLVQNVAGLMSKRVAVEEIEDRRQVTMRKDLAAKRGKSG